VNWTSALWVNATPEGSEGMCYTDPPGLDGRVRHSRGVLAAALHSVGFVNYPTEWWHWSYGDQASRHTE
jgi:zinc D-Ala-D-Ala dipeptidase